MLCIPPIRGLTRRAPPIDLHHGYHLSEMQRVRISAGTPKRSCRAVRTVTKGQSRNFRRRRQRVMIAVALTTLLAAMLLAIAFFAVMRSAAD